MMTLEGDVFAEVFEDELVSSYAATAKAKKKPVAHAGGFRWVVRGGAAGLALSVMSIVGTPSTAAAFDGRPAAVATARAMRRYGTMPENLRRDAAAARRVLRLVAETHDVTEPDYGF
jgi:hypothetical protein